MPENADETGSRLKELRSVLQWTQEDLAREVGRRASAVSAWERGDRPAPYAVLRRLADARGWPVEMFFSGPSPREVLEERRYPAIVAEGVARPTVGSAGGRTEAAVVYLEAMKDLMDYVDREEPVPPLLALSFVNSLWAAAVRSAPQLMRSGTGKTPRAAGDESDR